MSGKVRPQSVQSLRYGSTRNRALQRRGQQRRCPRLSRRNDRYVAFNGDKRDPDNNKLRFYKYYYEPLAQDHPPQGGGGPQIGLEGDPLVDYLEEWDRSLLQWRLIWARSRHARCCGGVQPTVHGSA
jgi:hypothetical protein